MILVHTRIQHQDVEIVQAFEDAIKEIGRQDIKWGRQAHTPAVWMQILTEEVGESAEEGNNVFFVGKDTKDMETELIQVAAVAIQAVASLRNQRENTRPV